MNIHQNARLTPRGRAEVVRHVMELAQSARRVGRERGVSEKTVRKWVHRVQSGEPLTDRSSRPRHSPQATPPATVLRIEVLRRQRRTCAEIAVLVGVSRATVARVIARCGWSRLHVLELPPTSRRYERAVPGELLHLDTKKLGRIVRPGHRVTGDRRDTVGGAGWEFAHMAVDDASRFAVGEVLPDEIGGTAVGFLRRTVQGLRRLGVRVAAVMTDNGSCYKSHRFAAACRRLGLRHLRTRRTRRAPTARSNALSRPRCWSGHTRASIATRTNAAPRSARGCTTTTGIAATRASVVIPRSPGSSPRTTS
jgi:transposase